MEKIEKRDWGKWAKAAGIRAIKTVAQAAIAAIGSTAVFTEVNWAVVGSTALVAGILSLLTSVAGIPEEEL
ncbi:MAG: hypothetical protein IJH75_01755 [Mogibacterium sp.]|nr:hypothetical protein [Mogibacterium sp.]